MIKLDKVELRNTAIQQLKCISKSDRESIVKKLTSNLIHTDVWNQATIIGITISNGFEWNTKPLIEAAWSEGKTICVPKCHPKDRQMDFYQINTYEQLEVVYYNLLEPIPEETKKIGKQMIDLLIVPGLLFDRSGYRIGFGGGYYDRFLTDFPNNTLSLATTSQLVDQLPAESYDVPVTTIITESGRLGQGDYK